MGRPAQYVGCNVQKCDRKHYSRGFCRMHYKRLQRDGDPGEAAARKHFGTEDIKWCADCQAFKPLTEFHFVKGKRQRFDAYCKFHKNGRTKEFRRQLRDQIFELLGNVCSYCGFEDRRALQIDHVNGGGTTELREMNGNFVRLHKRILENPKDYQVLCANCNQIKKFANDEIGGRHK